MNKQKKTLHNKKKQPKKPQIKDNPKQNPQNQILSFYMIFLFVSVTFQVISIGCGGFFPLFHRIIDNRHGKYLERSFSKAWSFA